MYPGEPGRYPRRSMDPGEQTTGTRDEHYDLISVLYHALHAAETIEAYVLDAEAVGEDELAEFFREAQVMHRQLAERAKGLLGIGIAAPGAGGVEPGTVPPASDVEDVPPDTAAPGDLPPRSADVETGMMPSPPVTPPGTVPLPDEDLIAETRGVVPDAPAEGEDVAAPAEAPSRLSPDAARAGPPETDVPPATPPQRTLGDVEEGTSLEPPEDVAPRNRATPPEVPSDTPREASPSGEERPDRRTPP